MRTTLLIIVGLAVLAVVVAAPAQRKKRRDVEKSTTVATETTDTANDESDGSGSAENPANDNALKSKVGKKIDDDADVKAARPSAPESKRAPVARKSSKKAVQDDDDEISASIDDDDDGISESIDDLLRDDDEEIEEIEIPSIDELTTESDPVEVGRSIKNITDRKKRNELVNKLRTAVEKNHGTLPGKFYRAALVAASKRRGAEEKAQNFWQTQLQRKVRQAMKSARGTMRRTNSGLGNPFSIGQTIAEIDPAGLALLKGESVLLTVLSDTLKNLSSVSDSIYNGVRTGSKLFSAATFPVDYIPVASTIKKNVHEIIERGADRGQYVWGNIADNASASFANAAKDVEKQAEKKEKLLNRQLSSTRTL